MENDRFEISDAYKVQLLFNLKVLNDYCDKSENLTKEEVDYLKIALPSLINFLPLIIEPVTSFSLPFERLVINENVCSSNKRLMSLEQLRYPPKNIESKLNYNRASLDGQSIFYAGSRGTLAITVETQPKKGQLITKSKWQFKNNQVLRLFIICQDEKIARANPLELLEDYNRYIKFLGSLDQNSKEVVIAIYGLIIKAFTRKVNPQKKQGYLFSALISDLIFNSANISADAIYYPSIPNDGASMNIAIKPDAIDSKFDMIEAIESVMIKNPQSGNPGWLSYRTGVCKSYDKSTLLLNWDNKIIPDNEPVNNIIKDYNIKFK